MAGVDLLTLKELGGWKQLSMVQRYAHLRPEHLQAAVERLVRQAEGPVPLGSAEAPGHRGTSPQLARDAQSAPAVSPKYWYARQGSNLRPTDSKSVALSN
jgi:hypothetical protein